MRLLKILFLSMSLLCGASTFAQLEITNGSFKEVGGFVNINEKQADNNNVAYSVIKVRTKNINDKARRELKFDGGVNVMIEMEYKDGEAWLYITHLASHLKISHPELGSVDFSIPLEMKPKGGYEMQLVNTKVEESKGWGKLNVMTTPEDGAVVTLNGKVLKQTTPYTNNMIAAGTYEVTVSKKGFRSVTKEVEINNGSNKNIKIEMPLAWGVIDLKTTPSGASVFVDGVESGKTPIVLDQIEIGRHEVRIENKNYATVIKNIVLDEDTPIVINETLEKGCKLIVKTAHIGDYIYINNELVGQSSLEMILQEGQYEICSVHGMDKKVKKLSKVSNYAKIQKNNITVDVDGGMINLVTHGFSVSDNKDVIFSKGNLQYQASTGIWRFAEHQWEYIGADNKNISPDYDGWIDLFGWGTGNDPTKSSTEDSEYGTFNEWGDNIISNGDDKQWRTLTINEWEYLLSKRNTPSGVRYAIANVDDKLCLILLPDNWDNSYYSLNEVNTGVTSSIKNIISLKDWKSRFEPNGAVCLPMAGKRINGTEFRFQNIDIWTSSVDKRMGEDAACSVDAFNGVYLWSGQPRCNGLSVRLVSDVE